MLGDVQILRQLCPNKEAPKRKKAIVMVTHDLRMVESCDAVYEMKDGYLFQKMLENVCKQFHKQVTCDKIVL